MFDYNFYHDVPRLCVEGTLVLGERGLMRNDCVVYVEKGARVENGTCFWMGHGYKIHSKSSISIKDNCQISLESQIFDTDNHSLMKADGTIDRCTKPVAIGENTWIGNRVTIGKGVKLGVWTVVTSNSFVNKDSSGMELVILGGVPAKVIKTGVTRIWDVATQSQLYHSFREHPNEEMCNLK